MESLLDNTTARFGIVVITMALLWLAEFGWPLAPGRKNSFVPNLVLSATSLAIYGLLGASLVWLTEWTATVHLGLFNWIPAEAWIKGIVGVLFLDFWASYLVHVLMHKIPILWTVHRIHHLDTMVDVTTAFRHHPFETLGRFLFLFIGTLILGLPLVVVIIYQTLSSINALLEHTNIKLNDRLERLLGLVVVTPGIHKIHHSVMRKETDSNYANLFTIWDRIFRTFSAGRVNQVIEYGLEKENADDDSTIELIVKPMASLHQQAP